MPVIIKNDGRREQYKREKLFDSIQKACQKRSVPTQKIDELINYIEKRIQSYGLKEIPSRTIGQIVMMELHQLDKVAYIRFASIYREFQDVEEFVAELQIPSMTQEDQGTLPFILTENEDRVTNVKQA